MIWGRFLDNIQYIASNIIDTFSAIFESFATSSVNTKLTQLIGFDVSIIDFTGLGDFTILELIIGVALPIVLAYQLVTWFLNLIT